MNCTKPEDRAGKEGNVTFYVAGIRSEWDREREQRQLVIVEDIVKSHKLPTKFSVWKYCVAKVRDWACWIVGSPNRSGSNIEYHFIALSLLTFSISIFAISFRDSDTTLVVNRPRYKPDSRHVPYVVDGEIIRDIDQWRVDE